MAPVSGHGPVPSLDRSHSLGRTVRMTPISSADFGLLRH